MRNATAQSFMPAFAETAFRSRRNIQEVEHVEGACCDGCDIHGRLDELKDQRVKLVATQKQELAKLEAQYASTKQAQAKQLSELNNKINEVERTARYKRPC